QRPPNAPSDLLTSQMPQLNKWPMKPGVHVHVNSLTSLADDSKSLYNNNTLSTQAKVGSIQNPHTISVGNNELVNRHHLNYIQALN
ncbi:hypothetical protein FHG87_015988, partial [Trinorchestia longiramus]